MHNIRCFYIHSLHNYHKSLCFILTAVRINLIYNNSCLKVEFIEDYEIILVSKNILRFRFKDSSYNLKPNFLNPQTSN